MIREKHDGGPAFPTTTPFTDEGMSIRDYFAAAALQGILAAHAGPDNLIFPTDKEAARMAYSAADAMLRARQEWSPQP